MVWPLVLFSDCLRRLRSLARVRCRLVAISFDLLFSSSLNLLFLEVTQKSSKNQPKIDQEETENPPKNQSKICQKSILEGSRGVFGGTCRPIPKNKAGALFFGTLLGPSWRPLGLVLAVLAASWARLGLVLPAELRPQVDQISTQKTIRTLMPLGIDFLEDFGGFWEVKWRQVGSKIGAKIDLDFKGRKSTKR